MSQLETIRTMEAEQIASFVNIRQRVDRKHCSQGRLMSLTTSAGMEDLRSSCCCRFAASLRLCSSSSFARLFSSSSICRRRLASSSRRSNSILKKTKEKRSSLFDAQTKSKVLIKHAHEIEIESQITNTRD